MASWIVPLFAARLGSFLLDYSFRFAPSACGKAAARGEEGRTRAAERQIWRLEWPSRRALFLDSLSSFVKREAVVVLRLSSVLWAWFDMRYVAALTDLQLWRWIGLLGWARLLGSLQ